MAGDKASDSWDERDAGKLLVDQIISLMHIMNIPDGLLAIGYSKKDIPALVKGYYYYISLTMKF